MVGGRRWVAGRVLLVGLLVSVFSVLPALAETFDITIDEERLLELTNAARSDAGLPLLRNAPELMYSAETKARDLEQRGYFSHYSPEGTSPFDLMRQAGADFSAAGENIARGPTLDKIFAGWMNSPDHRRIILGREYTHFGIGVVSQGGTYWAVQHFVRLRTAAKDHPPAPEAATAPASAQGPSAPGERAYVVQPGDTLPLIAQRLGFPLWRLLVENGFSVLGELNPGRIIRLPQL